MDFARLLAGNTAHLHPRRLGRAIAALRANTTHAGTVVRWSAGFALGAILVLDTAHNGKLVPKAEAIAAREPDNAIRKHYARALKQLAKGRPPRPSRASSGTSGRRTPMTRG
jgi:hypothetical protein